MAALNSPPNSPITPEKTIMEGESVVCLYMFYCNFYNHKVFCRKKKLEKKKKRKKKELHVLVARKALERTAGIGGEGFVVGRLIFYGHGVCCA